MSNGLSGLTQYIWAAEDDRRERRRNHNTTVFINYVLSFGKHAYELTGTCPECHKHTVKATKVGSNKAGLYYLKERYLPEGKTFDDCLVVAIWKCETCGNTETKTVSFRELLEDLNNPNLRN